jgi:hypothetical protein
MNAEQTALMQVARQIVDTEIEKEIRIIEQQSKLVADRLAEVNRALALQQIQQPTTTATPQIIVHPTPLPVLPQLAPK